MFFYIFLCSFNFTGAQAGCTNINLLRRAVNHRLYRLDVGFPHPVRSSMRMAHVVTEMSTLFANTALCHSDTSLSSVKSIILRDFSPFRLHNTSILAKIKTKCKKNFIFLFRFYLSRKCGRIKRICVDVGKGKNKGCVKPIMKTENRHKESAASGIPL